MPNGIRSSPPGHLQDTPWRCWRPFSPSVPDRSGTGVPAGAAVAAGQGTRRRPLGAARRAGADRRGRRRLGVPAVGREGRPGAGRAPGADRGVLRPGAGAGRAGGGHRIPRPGAAGRRPAICRTTPPGTRWTTCRRPRSITASSSTGPTGGCRRSCPTPTSGSRWRRPSFTIAELRRVYATALDHDVDPTNLQRILTRRGMLEPTGTTAASGPDRRPAGRDVPVHHRRAAGHGSVRGVPAAPLKSAPVTPRSGRPFQATRNV